MFTASVVPTRERKIVKIKLHHPITNVLASDGL